MGSGEKQWRGNSMYTVITDEKEIKTCQERFINILSTNTIAGGERQSMQMD
jgi:hypothetical protein